ncbi:MAG: 2Fe-2S iron-sulfur cluster-binding protein [Blastocatellia bacterium]
MMQITINQQPHTLTDSGLTVLQAVRAAGIELPALCHDDRLKPCGECRMCLVEVAGTAHPLTACNTPLAAGMRIATHTPALEEERRGLLAMLAARYPPAAMERAPENKVTAVSVERVDQTGGDGDNR